MILILTLRNFIKLSVLRYLGIYYTIYNEKYFQKVSFCVITHLIGQNGRAVCKKHGNHGDAYARGAKRRALGAAGHRSRVRVHTSTALGPTGPRPRLQYS